MTETKHTEIIDRVRAIAGTCYCMVTMGEIMDVIQRVSPGANAEQTEKLIRDCQRVVQIVSQEEKEKMLQAAYPEERTEQRPNPALMDTAFCILLQRRMDPKVKNCWIQAVEKDARLRTILRNRKNTAPERLAESLGVSQEDFYCLEREIINLYYTCADKVRMGKI